MSILQGNIYASSPRRSDLIVGICAALLITFATALVLLHASVYGASLLPEGTQSDWRTSACDYGAC